MIQINNILNSDQQKIELKIIQNGITFCICGHKIHIINQYIDAIFANYSINIHMKISGWSQIISVIEFQPLKQKIFNKYSYCLKNSSMWTNKNNKNAQCQCSIFATTNKTEAHKQNKVTLKKKQIPKIVHQKESVKQKASHKLAIKKPNVKINEKSKEVLNKVEIKKELINPPVIQKQKTTVPINNFKQILKIPTFTTKIPVKQTPAIIKKTILTSEYFSGLQIKNPEKKQQCVEFSYQNHKIQPQNMNRQASLNDFKKKSQQAVKLRQELLKRSQSDKQINSRNKFKFQNIQQKPTNIKNQNSKLVKEEKSNSIKSATNPTLKNFQQLRPKSTVSSGENLSENNSQYSEVIESNLLNRDPIYYLDQQI